MSKDVRKTERFTQIPIYSNLSSREVAQIISITEEVIVEPGKDVFAPGEPADAFYVVQSGRIEIRLVNEERADKKMTIATLSDRSVFGEMSFLHDRPRSAYASAVEETRLSKIKGAEFRALMEKGDLAAYKVIHNFALLIASRLRRVENELVNALNELGPGKRTQRLKELQEFRNTLFQEWSF